MTANPSVDRERFLSRIGPGTPFYALFDRIPGVSFFAKDLNFRLMCANQAFVERFGFAEEAQIVGKDDFQLFPARLAENFRHDDEEVIRTGEPKWRIVELFFSRQGLPDWFVTDKMPVRDKKGKVIGVMGISRGYGSAPEEVHAHERIARAVDHIRKHFREKITIEGLAELTHLSTRQLHRRFVEAFGLSPQAVVMKLRIQAGCELLSDPDVQISEAARAVGFTDQSSFTLHFHKHMGVTPLRYRRQFV